MKSILLQWTPKAATEVKKLKLEMSKDGEPTKPTLCVKLHILPLLVYMGEPQLSYDQSSDFDQGGSISSIEASLIMSERASAPFICEELSFSCEIGHHRDAGFITKNMDITIREVIVNLNEDLLLRKKTPSETFLQADTIGEPIVDSGPAKDSQKKQKALLSLKKHTIVFPEKVSLNLPKLDLRFVHRGQDLVVENNIMGIYLRSNKSQSNEDMGESTHFEVQMGFSELHILRESGTSVLEILKFAVVSSVYVPVQLETSIRAEIDIKLGGAKCNIITSRLIPWVRLHLSKKKKMVLRDENSKLEKPQTTETKATETKAILWNCKVSAPEITIVLYSISGSPLYYGCSQSLHMSANNIGSTGVALLMELGELYLRMTDEHQELLKESLFGMETNSGSLVHVAKVNLDWGKKDMESVEKNPNKHKLVLYVDVTGMGVYFSIQRVEFLISAAMSFQKLFKSMSAPGKRMKQNITGRSAKSSGKGTRLLKLHLERCSVIFCGDVGVENTTVADPKRVNYGSQGGEVVISVLADGTPRRANIISMTPNDCKHLNYSISLDIIHFNLRVNKEKQSIQMEIERAKSIYQEFLEEHRSSAEVTLLDMQNAKFVRRSGGLSEVICSLFSATDISVRWEPDVHLSLIELMLRLKLLVQNEKLKEINSSDMKEEISGGKTLEPEKETKVDHRPSDKEQKRRESVFAIDVDMLNISAGAGDGVEAEVQVQSIFSENARIGVLLEGLMVSFNEARIFKSSRMQISRIPNASNSSFDSKVQAIMTWDWVIQGFDVHICMPYRLQLRAIDDAVEDMLRGLKLITNAKTNILFPIKKESSKPKKSSSEKFGCIRFCIRKLKAEIEEEPLQGWLDEHYHLMKNEACELALRLKFLDDLVSESSQSCEVSESNEPCLQRKIYYDGTEINLQDASAVEKVQEEIHKQTFQSYYQSCQNLVLTEGSGAFKKDFQAGFKFSTSRTSLLSVCATELDVTLKKIEGGDVAMIEIIKKLDPICQEKDIPFSRLYGSNINLHAGSLVAQLRNYTYPLFSATSGKCEGRIVFGQQATCFQPQIQQDVFIGRWRKVRMMRSASGTTPPIKTYADLPLYFQKGEISFGVGFEPSFTDISYAFTVALRRADLSVRSSDPNFNNPNASDASQTSNINLPETQPPKKERSLPWWDEVRNYVHGKISLCFSETRINVLGTTDPYEKHDKLQAVTKLMEIQQSDGHVNVYANEFKIFLSSLESFTKNCSSKLPPGVGCAFLECPYFSLEVTMEWECESGNPLDHYLFALPNEGEPRKKVFDPFRSTSLSLRWNFSLRPSVPPSEKQSHSITKADGVGMDGTVSDSLCKPVNVSTDMTKLNFGSYDLCWVFKFWNLNYLPPLKIRSFSRYPRFGVPRVPRSGNLSLDKVMTEFMLRLDITPLCIRHVSLEDDDPATGFTFKIAKLRCELGYGRGRQKFTFDCKRDTLDLVYQGIDLHMPKAYFDKEDYICIEKEVQMARKNVQSASTDRVNNEKSNYVGGYTEKHHDDGFLLSFEYFTIRRQTPKADPVKLLAWLEAGRKNLEMKFDKSEFKNGSDSDDPTQSDHSDDDGFNVVVADNCQRVFLYGLKVLWTLENRNAVLSLGRGIIKAVQPPKPSPSRQYTQRKLLEKQVIDGAEVQQDDVSKPSTSAIQATNPPAQQHVETVGSTSSPSDLVKEENSTSDPVAAKNGNTDDLEEEGTLHFMVNVIQPQFNLHSEEANGRFLFAAASGRVLARSFHSVVHVGFEMIEKTLVTGSVSAPESQPEMTWNRAELSVILEHVQAHVAPTDVDPGAGIQWLPKILRSSPKVKRTGALLERVFMPCTMYFRYTRHKGGTADLKVKPLKELSFNSPDITATMTSRQFQVMVDVLTNLLLARAPRPQKSNISYLADDDEDTEEEADEVVPDGVEEVELAKIELEQKERERNLLFDDIRRLSACSDASGNTGFSPEKEENLWMLTCGRSTLVQFLKKELGNTQKSRKAASVSLRMALQKAAQVRLMEKEKNKSPSCAMRISLRINKVAWSMLLDGKSFSEAEINHMTYDFDRDYKDHGVAKFTTKSIVVRNCLPNAKSDTLLSAWNPPSEWGKNVMLRVDAKQGAPKDGNSVIELFQVEIYPLKIHLAETMYRMIWAYFFPGEEHDLQKRQEVWKVSTTAGAKRVKKGTSSHEATASSSHSTRESDASSKLGGPAASLATSGGSQLSSHSDFSQVSKLQNSKANTVGGSTPELRRTSSCDRTWEENVAESVANEVVLRVNSSSRNGPLNSIPDHQEEKRESWKDKMTMPIKPGRSSNEEKKVGKTQDEKRDRPRKMIEFQNVKISQVELLLTYEGSRFAVSDLRLLMDPFQRVDFIGSWPRLFSRVKKHIIWGVLKSVTGMQGKKFKGKGHNQKEATAVAIPLDDLNLSDSDGDQAGKSDQLPIAFLKKPTDGAGDGFVTSIKGLFSSQRRKAKALVLRTMRGEEDNEFHGEWSESDAEFSPFARQLTITKAKKLIRRHSKKLGKKGSASQEGGDSHPSTPRDEVTFESDSTSGSSPSDDPHEEGKTFSS
ncbi:PREDICTED: protein SABRE-like isoform X1 [Nelumbo nucifera]|uniref:Protein SABRE-like isoform X1 n=1 Tax=Nelumbo nucifera TaxID=4432 RepID=A0A1U8BIX3_NELNU|nr:PREDICTED: protein SABRE-like isoform X1 [Nelumbo nucifera]